MILDAATLQLFRDEALERLGDLETCLLGMHPDRPNPELVDGAFRALHTIKGSGAMFGLDHLVEFSHLAESLFARIRDGDLPLSAEMIEIGLQVKDFLHRLLPGSEATDEELSSGLELRDAISALLPARKPAPGQRTVQAKSVNPTDNCGGEETVSLAKSNWRIRFQPGPALFRNGTNPLQLLKDLQALGTLIVLGNADAIPSLDSIDPEACYLSWELMLHTELGQSAIRDIFIFVENDSKLEISQMDDGIPGPGDLDFPRLTRFLVETGQIPAELTSPESRENRPLALTRAIEDWLAERGFINPAKLKSFRSDLEFLHAARDPRTRQERDVSATIKVATAKLDALTNLVGELVTMQSRYSLLAGLRQDDELTSLNEEMDGLTRSLRNLSMDMHMVPLDLLFSSYQRLIRDLGRQLGKQVRLETSGTDTELEKNIIEELKDPLLHLIRNAMDHGIENPEKRQAAGKDPTGTLSLGARYEGASVVISVEDDGAGLNTDAILRKAIERQLISPDSKLSPDEINQLIFLPGFSTASSVSNVSGRGVGMDVVKRSIEGLRGSINVQTRAGKGSSIRLRIPLSLSVVEALLVQVGGELYAINLTSIIACRAADSLKRMAGGDLVIFDEQPVPRIDLTDFFNPGHAGKSDGVVIFLSNGERTVGLLVDEVLNSIQAVIKTLGKAFTDARGLNGAVVLGDGSLALVIDSEYFQSTHGKRSGLA